MPAELMTRRAALPLQQRPSLLAPSTYNDADSTVEVVWTTGASVRRLDFWNGTEFDEELVVTPEAVNMARFDAGAVQVLDGHDRHRGVNAILGIATAGWIANGEGRALVRLSQRDDLAGITADIEAGVIRAMSFGYSVERYEIVPAEQRKDGGQLPLYRAVRWTPQEISFVAVPADPNAGTRAAPDAYPCEFITPQPQRNTVPTTTTAPQRDEEVAEIRALAQRHGLPTTFADDLVTRGTSLAVAGAAIMTELALRDRAAGGHLNVSATGYFRGSEAGSDPSAQMVEALAARMGGAPAPAANPYRHAGVTDLARDCLERAGVRTSNMSRPQLIERAISHGAGDFPELLMGAGQRVLRQAYGAYEGGIKRMCRASTARDFRTKQMLMLGEFPTLLQTNEHSEFKQGSMGEAKSSYALLTYGRIFGITRQALVNDDLDAFGTMATRIGRAAAELEAKTLVTLLTSNPTMGDSVALFHASHGNLATGAGSALQVSALTTARTAMRLQKGQDRLTAIDATPQYLVVPAALETTAEQLLATLTPSQVSSVNPFSGKLELLVDPRLDAVSTTAWYLAASPATLDTIEYSYLESAGGPEVIVREGFEVDGVETKVRLDFGAGVLDWRGLYRANGA